MFLGKAELLHTNPFPFTGRGGGSGFISIGLFCLETDLKLDLKFHNPGEIVQKNHTPIPRRILL